LIEAPSFYICLQVLQDLGLKAIEVATDCRDGIDLGCLARVIEQRRPAACWVMTNFQNPLGTLMSSEKKRELVALLAAHEIPLVEDDVYGELYFGSDAPRSAKSFDTRGLVLHCSSFSKCLAPGYRVGWTAAGQFARKVERLKLATFLEGSMPAQAAIARYLQEGGFDAHLRRLRRELEAQQRLALRAVQRYFPASLRMQVPRGGYFLWMQLPAEVDAMELYRAALQEGVSLAPGPMFSLRRDFRSCIRLNTGQVWTPEVEKGYATIGRLVREQVGAAHRDPSATALARTPDPAMVNGG
jgi:DNA-binding transcriptional MocR family regulator